MSKYLGKFLKLLLWVVLSMILVFLVDLYIYRDSYKEIIKSNKKGNNEIKAVEVDASSLRPGIVREKTIIEEPQKRSFSGGLDEIIALVNSEREVRKLKPLVKNEKLMASALSKAENMKEFEYFEHVSPDGLAPAFFVGQEGYDHQLIGENLAEGFFSPQSVHEAWMNSPGHKSNIINDKFEEIGVAVLEMENEDGLQSYIIVQHFATKLKPVKPVKPTIVCKKESKKICEKNFDREDELEDLIEEQEEIIEEAEDDGWSKKDLRDLFENLEKLEEAEDEAHDLNKECKEFIKGCDLWR